MIVVRLSYLCYGISDVGQKTHLKIMPAKSQPICSGLSVSRHLTDFLLQRHLRNSVRCMNVRCRCCVTSWCHQAPLLNHTRPCSLTRLRRWRHLEQGRSIPSINNGHKKGRLRGSWWDLGYEELWGTDGVKACENQGRKNFEVLISWILWDWEHRKWRTVDAGI